MNTYIMAIDQGTTGTQVSFFRDSDLAPMSRSKVEFPQHYPQPGWVEHDLKEIEASLISAYQNAFRELQAQDPVASPQSIIAIGITNQRETACAWSRRTGRALCRAIVWQDRRTADSCAARRSRGLSASLLEETGLVLDPYFSASKFEWMLQNSNSVQVANREKDLCFGTIDSWLISLISGGRFHATDHTNASRTQLYSLRTQSWSNGLLNEFQIPEQCLPQILPSVQTFETLPSRTNETGFETGIVRGAEAGVPRTSGFLDLPDGVPVLGVVGDQQASLFGLGGVHEGSAKITFGTGAFLLVHTGKRLVLQPDGLLSTVAFSDASGVSFAREGSAFVAGAAVQFLRDNFGWISSASEIESLAQKNAPDDNVFFVPALAGLGAPWWNPHAKGAVLGLSRGTQPSQICYAVLESLAFQNALLLEKLSGSQKLEKVLIDGGAAANTLLAQLQAEVLSVPVVRGKNLETTSLGAAKAAWLGLHPGEKTAGADLRENLDEHFRAGSRWGQHTNAQKFSRWKLMCNSLNEMYSKLGA